MIVKILINNQKTNKKDIEKFIEDYNNKKIHIEKIERIKKHTINIITID